MAVVPAAASAATGSIAGTVKDAVTLEGVEGVEVCVWSLEAGEEEEFSGCAHTETDGTYFFGGLQAGEYKVEFWSQRRYQVQFYDHKATWSEADPVVVVAATTTEGIDADLQPSSEIEGTVTASVGGAGIGEVEVCAWGIADERFGGCTETQSDGSYVLHGLEAGEWGIEFWPWEGNFLPQFYNHKASWSEADPVLVGSGESISGIDAQLDPGAAIAGHITSASGAPLEEINACALDASSGELVRCRWSDAQGAYELPRLPPGQYKVGFSLEEEEFDDGFATQFWNNQPTFATANVIPLATGQTVTGIDARLGSPPPVAQSPAVVTPPPAPPVRKHKKHCRKGLKRKKIKGKYRCVKPKKHHRHHH
ncbi:MAG: hypothetical protein ACTHN3_09385 [Solirubrobacterales bacterium]